MSAPLPCLASFVNDTLAPRHGSPATALLSDERDVTELTAPPIVSPLIVAELRSALAHMRADERELWIKVGLALKCLGNMGRGLWLVWSQTSEKYDPLDAARTWDSLAPNNINYLFLFAEAQRRGWVNPGDQKNSDFQVPEFIVNRRFSTGGRSWRDTGEENSRATDTSTDQLKEYRFRLLNGPAVAALPPVVWRIRNIFSARSINVIYGPSTSGKTFVALDQAVAIAEGRVWFGYRVMAAVVIYVALEGEGGFRARIAALEKANGRPLPLSLFFVFQSFNITNPQDVRELAAAIVGLGECCVVYIDTLNRAAPGLDENSSKDMGAILEGTKNLQLLIDGLVVLVSHTGKDVTKGLRGHSSLFAAMDGAIEVSRDGDRRCWRVAKSKDGQDGGAHPFRLDIVELGEDDDGESIASCVVVPETRSEGSIKSRVPKGANQKIAWDAIRPLFTGGTPGKPGAPPGALCVTLEDAVTVVSSRLSCPVERRNERARAAIIGLQSLGFLGCWEGNLWQT